MVRNILKGGINSQLMSNFSVFLNIVNPWIRNGTVWIPRDMD